MRRKAGLTLTPVTPYRAFTLIELLVVIAIIGILAAMLFPVFARARESARKTQCLANVKNIALAVNMYLVDYDKLFPLEHRADVRQWFADNADASCTLGQDCKTNASNPYLRHPVILDDYIKNRDVWRCPSSKFVKSYAINPGYGNGRWFEYFVAQQDAGACYLGAGSATFPPGWGGDVTDSALQGGCSEAAGFQQSVAIPWTLDEKSSSSIDDAAKWVAVADAGIITEQLDRTSWAAYPDYCRIDSVLCNTDCGGDWVNCPDTQQCSPQKVSQGGDGKTASDVQARKERFGGRHLGGSNLGFVDGHAKWFPSEYILFAGGNASGYGKEPQELFGLDVCFNPTATPRP